MKSTVSLVASSSTLFIISPDKCISVHLYLCMSEPVARLIKTYAPSAFDSTQTLTQTLAPIEGFFKVKSVALNKIVLETGDILKVQSNTANSLDTTMSIMEQT